MELIKYKGFRVPTRTRRASCSRTRRFADACAVPVRDEEAGDVPKAFDVIPKSPSGELLRRVPVQREREAGR